LPMPAVATEPTQKHPALIWLIRGTGALIAIPSVLMLVVGLVMGVISLFHRTGIQGWLMALFLLLPVITFGTTCLVGYCMWRRIDKTTVANFAFIFAVLVARTFYYSLPPHLPKVINEHLWIFFRDQGDRPGFTYRGFWAFLVFILFYNLIKACLMQTLELNASSSSQNLPPIDPDIPEFPQKSPLVQL
jgi:hypothetical protein